MRHRSSHLNAILTARTTVALLIFTLCVVCCSCDSHKHPGKKIFHYNDKAGIATLDPSFARNQSIMWAVHQLYNTLVEVDSNMQIAPSIAKSWDISPDNLVFTFHLRTDVRFHDDDCFPGSKGRQLVAADVVYSFSRIMDRSVASTGAWIFNNRVDSLDAFRALDDSTFRIKLAHRFQPILGILSMQYCSILPHEAIEKYKSDFRRHPVGSGPFAFVAWEEGQALILKRNDHYFEKDSAGRSLPYLDGIKVSFYESKATEFLEFRQDRLDFINDIDPSFKDEVLTKAGGLKKDWEGIFNLHKHSYLNTEYIGILVDMDNELLKNSPLRLQKVRQAINYGFDRRKLMLYLRNSIGTPAESGFIPAGFPSFDSSIVKGYHYDPAKARQLLEEAGFPGGKGLSSVKLMTYDDIGTYIASELSKIDINVKVETIEKKLLEEQMSKSQVPMFRKTWIADYPDAENYLGVFYSKNPAPPNYTRYKNPAFDALYDQALDEKNDSLRYILYRQMDNMIVTDAPVIPLFYDMVIHLVHTNIKDFNPNSLNLLELRRVQKL